MDLREGARALLRDCERFARHATRNDFAEAHVHPFEDGVFVAVAFDVGGFGSARTPSERAGPASAAFAEGYGATPEQALDQLRRALGRQIREAEAGTQRGTATFDVSALRAQSRARS